jgi:alpha-amylase/alpha-mannosidase (GH57 family)
MRSTLKGNDDLYGKVKKIAEELRAMSFTFNIPVVSVSQLNREGSSIINLREIDFTHISESLGLPATVDFMSIFGSDDENMIYKSELSYKIVKNRLGGRVGTINKLYFDSRTLKIYDVTEIDQWIEDANKSGDDRELAPKENRRTPGRRKD